MGISFDVFIQQVRDNSGAIAAVSTVGTAFVRVTWSASTAAIQWLSWRFSVRTRKCEITIGPYEDVHGLVKSMQCLVVRYGNDRYLTSVASARDRWEGRLQNKIIRIRERREGGKLLGKFSLKVHKRLGTQFVCAVDAIDEIAAKKIAAQILPYPADPSSEQKEIAPRQEGRRVFILLSDHAIHTGLKVTSVDDIHSTDGRPIYNNMYYPF